MTFRRALVTGCCGFIGAHVTRLLVNEGWYVEGVDDLSNGDLSSIADMKFRAVHEGLLGMLKKTDMESSAGGLMVVTGDFASNEMLARVADGRYDVIFHLAANPRVEFSVKHPALTTHHNVQKTVELMTAARDNIDRFVFASSSACYGNVDTLPTTETTPSSPTSPYGLQKLVIEQFGKLYSDLYGMDFAALRFFNAYGPGQDGTSPYSTAISAWCTKLSKQYPLRSDGDGTQTRDMVYVEDIAAAMVQVADHSDPIGFDIFNVGNGESFENREILEYLKESFPAAEVDHAPDRPGDVKHTLASISKIHDVIGWTPKVQFWEGLDRTLKWWRLL
jgi:UDP-glucose 4-epimerase